MISSLQIQWFALRWMWVRHNCGEWEDCRVDTTVLHTKEEYVFTGLSKMTTTMTSNG